MTRGYTQSKDFLAQIKGFAPSDNA